MYTFGAPCPNCVDNYESLLRTFPKIKFHIYFSNIKKDYHLPDHLQNESRLKIEQIYPHQKYKNLFSIFWNECFKKLDTK